MRIIKTKKYNKIAQWKNEEGEEGYYWCPSCKKKYTSKQDKWCHNCGSHLNWIRIIEGKPLHSKG